MTFKRIQAVPASPALNRGPSVAAKSAAASVNSTKTAPVHKSHGHHHAPRVNEQALRDELLAQQAELRRK